MQLKKIFMTLLVVVIAISTLTFAVAAAPATTPSIDFAVSVSGTADADGRVVFEPGDTVDVVIDVHNNPEPGIALLEVHLKYNSAIFAPADLNDDGTFNEEDCTAGAFLDAETYVFDAKNGEIVFKTSLAGTPTPIVDEDGNYIKDGEIVRLSFKVLEGAHAKETAISFGTALAVVVDGAKMQPATVNTTVAKLAVHDIEETEGQEATCFDKGWTASSQCTQCDYGVASTEIPPLNHEGFLVEIPAVPGNCTTPAVSAGEMCSKCGTITKAPETGDAVAHTPSGEWVVDEPATHLKPGKQHQICVNCGEVALKGEIPQILAHNWVADGEPVPPTCLDAGYTLYKCECGETKHDNLVDALGHAWGDGKITTEATCLNNGEITYTCANCGETKTANIDALDHAWDDGKITIEATCDTVGQKTYTCANCDETKNEVVAKVAHDYATTVVDPTCTTAGYTAHDCKNCDAYYEDTVVAALGHAWGEGVVTTAPTCTALGEKTYTCANCDETKTENVAMVEHDYVVTVVDPTCTTAGYTAHDCKNCDAYYEDTVVAALGHAWGDGVVTTAPTCTALGEKTYTCANCNETKTENVAMVEHDYVVTVVAPTCTTAGYTAHDCKNCDAYYEDAPLAAKGHTYAEAGKVDATCTKPGEITYACVCGVKYTVATELKAHDFKEAGKVDATCNKPGEITYACACGVKYTTNTELAKHQYESEITSAATCNASGVKTNTCKVCGDTYVETVDMIAHTFEDKVTDPTCTTMGYTTHTCTVCEYKVVDTFIDAKGHNLVVDEAVDPTATEEGKTQGLHCSECDLVHLAQVTVPAKGLTWLWVMIAVVVIVAGACVAMFFIFKKTFSK